MGVWDSIKAFPQAIFRPNITYVGSAEAFAEEIGLDSVTPARLFATQPHLHTVITFLARNIAQLGVHTFERVDSQDRRRDRSSAVAQVLARPNEQMTSYDLFFALVADLALYDRAFWHVSHDGERWMIRRLPPAWVSPVMKNAFIVDHYAVAPSDGDVVKLPPGEVLAFTGYNPANPAKGSPAITALRDTLQEQIEASRYRGQVWKRGGRVSAVIERPSGAKWSDAAREQFREDWYSKYTGRGKFAGGTPILEDGMTIKRIDFNAQEQQYVEAAKLSLTTVASAFHVNPTMIGILDNANYSNVREFRRMLYGDSLGPIIAQIEGRLNTFLLPMLDIDPDRFYVEFNIAEKLQGSFEEQAQVMQTLVGAPIMTRNEARARFNLAALDEAEGLVTPLNVLVGGQASPTDSGSQNVGPKSIETFWRKQRASVLSRIGAGSKDWWDRDRWDAELGQIIHPDAAKKINLAVETTIQSALARPSTEKPVVLAATAFDHVQTQLMPGNAEPLT